MPAIRHISNNQFTLLVWRIEEDFNFFAQNVRLNFHEKQEFDFISVESRKLEWMASRYVQRQICDSSLLKDEYGKPYPKDADGFVSISHCKNYAAAIYSKNQAVGLDIEPINDKVQRIATKFLSEIELKALDLDAKTEHLIACWTIKEAVYKWFGKKELSFINNIRISKFAISDANSMVRLERDTMSIELNIHLEKIDNLRLAYL